MELGPGLRIGQPPGPCFLPHFPEVRPPETPQAGPTWLIPPVTGQSWRKATSLVRDRPGQTAGSRRASGAAPGVELSRPSNTGRAAHVRFPLPVCRQRWALADKKKKKRLPFVSSAHFSIWLTRGMPSQVNSESPNKQPDAQF